MPLPSQAPSPRPVRVMYPPPPPAPVSNERLVQRTLPSGPFLFGDVVNEAPGVGAELLGY